MLFKVIIKGKILIKCRDENGKFKTFNNEDIEEKFPNLFDESPLIQKGIIKFMEEIKDNCIVESVFRIIAQPQPTGGQKITFESNVQAENKLLIERKKDYINGHCTISKIDQDSAFINSIQTINNVAELRYLTTFDAHIKTPAGEKQQLIIPIADYFNQTKYLEIFKKMSTKINGLFSKNYKFSTELSKKKMFIFASPNFVSALKRMADISIICCIQNGKLMFDNVQVIEMSKFIGKNVIPGMFHETETLDLSKYHGILVTENCITSYISNIQIKIGKEVTLFGEKFSYFFNAMVQSKVFEEFKDEMIAFVSEQII